MCNHSMKNKRHKANKALRKKIMAQFLQFFIFIRVYIDKFIDYIFGLYYKSKIKIVSKPTNPLVLESATSLAKQIREQLITSEQVVEACINRIKEVNPLINAVVDDRFDDALIEAKNVDAQIKANLITEEEFNAKPFLGVPFTTKESTSCKGMRVTFGLLARKHKKADEDADVVCLMKNAGGILLGITNIPILNMWQETSNPIYGYTNNPYNTTRNVGGSSGGEGAIIAACGVPFGIGTDIGGSIRIPAFKCGVFGHKPTTGLISTKGLTYRTGNEFSSIVAVGPLTRSADDLIPFLKILLDKNVNKLQLDKKVNVKDLRVFYMLDSDDIKMSALTAEMRSVILRTVKYFEQDLNVMPEKLDLPDLKYGDNLWRYWMKQEGTKFTRDLTDRTGEINRYLEIIKFITCQSEFNLGAIANLISTMMPLKNERWLKDLSKQLLNTLTELLDDTGVLLYPSAPWSARYHDTSVFRPFNFSYFSVWNVFKFPVTQVPLGLDSEGLPVGIQVVAAPYQDHLCITVAKELEKAFGGYVPF